MEQANAEIKRRYKLSGPNENDILESSAGKAVEAEDAELTRLQALLSLWLRMENVAVLMAAGCSVSHEGLPLAKLEMTVISFLKDYYKKNGEKKVNLHAFVDKRLASLNETGISSFEAWLSYLSNAAFLTSQKESPISDFKWKDEVQLKTDELKMLLNDLRRAIYAWCSLQLPNPGDKTSGHHAFVAKLISRDPSLGRAKIFTLNYDTLIEQALDHLGIHYVDGFVGQAERRFEPSCYGLDIYYPGDVSEGRVRRYDKFIQLYKLHGSIHWWERNGGKDVLASHPSLSAFLKWRADVSKRTDNFDGLFRDEFGPMGILPTSNKYIQTLDLPYAHLFRAFHQTLQQPQTFFIVAGYGFGDEHVNRIIEDALINPSFVMLVVDPQPNEYMVKRIKAYQQMGARVYLFSPYSDSESTEITSDGHATFDDFAKNVLPNISWLYDWIKLKKMENILKRNPDTAKPLDKDDDNEW